jgi:hypothetical protein
MHSNKTKIKNLMMFLFRIGNMYLISMIIISYWFKDVIFYEIEYFVGLLITNVSLFLIKEYYSNIEFKTINNKIDS